MTLQKRLVFAILILVGVIFIGTIGYFFIEKSYNLIDAFYMTIITVATVGFREVHELSPGGRIFTIFIIVTGMGTVLFALSTFTAFVVEGELQALIRRRKMQKVIDKMKDHYIICGAGATGRYVIEEFIKTRIDFVVVDKSLENIQKLLEEHSFPYIEGDAADETILRKAGVERAKGLVTTLPEDKDNLFVVLTARELNPKMRIVAKSVEEETRSKLLKVGADSVVSPNNIGGLRMASEMIRPAVVTFLDSMMRDPEMTLRVEEATIKKDSDFIEKNIAEADIGKKTGVIVVAVKDAQTGRYVFNPSSSMKLKEDDILIMIGNLAQVQNLRRLAERSGLLLGTEQPEQESAEGIEK